METNAESGQRSFQGQKKKKGYVAQIRQLSANDLSMYQGRAPNHTGWPGSTLEEKSQNPAAGRGSVSKKEGQEEKKKERKRRIVTVLV